MRLIQLAALLPLITGVVSQRAIYARNPYADLDDLYARDAYADYEDKIYARYAEPEPEADYEYSHLYARQPAQLGRRAICLKWQKLNNGDKVCTKWGREGGGHGH